ncbi:hypothetical protein LOD99_5331 [Oopsacas minuta]|uniref:Uncharacterized protein n=1 Tax=Oopsacas minuta TaxID=111878 RepID=A0AAV7JS58_9METZ|nr:hypothetical protein LOD99_5331 [Oopsacas minuta]
MGSIDSTNQEAIPTKFQKLSDEIDGSMFEDLQTQDALTIGSEVTLFATMPSPTQTHQDAIDKLTLMKSQILNSIRTNIPLTDLHRELHMRRDMKSQELFNWQTDRYPST